jgi:DNA-binding GntR family transcriptional regulator
MDNDLVKRRRKELNARQAAYVANRERGATRQQSAILAGYADVDKAGEQVEEAEVVQEALQEARTELAKATGITKEQILEGLKEAADMAKLLADPQAMVRAWSEIGKMLGHYAPEVKKHLHGVDPKTAEALKALSDAELYKISRGRVVEGEFVLIDTKKEAE